MIRDRIVDVRSDARLLEPRASELAVLANDDGEAKWNDDFHNAAFRLFNDAMVPGQKYATVVRTDVFRSLALRERGFAIEAEITARLLQQGERIFEVPVSYKARATEEGKKLTALDGLRVVRTLLRCRVS